MEGLPPISLSDVRELWLGRILWKSPVGGASIWSTKLFQSMQQLVLVGCKFESILNNLQSPEGETSCSHLSNIILYISNKNQWHVPH